MNGIKAISPETMEWLLDPADPGPRYLALRDVCRLPEDSPELIAAREQAHREGPIARVLSAMDPEGFWEKPGPGYGPKYRSTVWAIILLAQLGARVEQDERVAVACSYLVDHALAQGGQLSYNGAPGGTIDCLQGNLLWSLVRMGYKDDRLEKAYEWMARSVTGEGVAPASEKKAERRYYAYKCGPLFACGPNNGQPCAWGAVKVMLAFGAWSGGGGPFGGGSQTRPQKAPLIEQAVMAGADFLLDNRPAEAGWPNGINEKPSGNWWKFGFPVFYITDLLQVAEAMASLGYGADPRMAPVWQVIAEKKDAQGRWPLEYDYRGKTHGVYGKKGQANKWVTIRALRNFD